MKKSESELLRNKIQELINRRLLTVKQLAAIMGKSSSTASLWLSGSYTGDTNSLDIIVTDWLARTAEADNVPMAPHRLIETQAYRDITAELKIAHANGQFRVIYGEAGRGKTEACRAFAAALPNVILIETRPSFTTLFFIQLLSRQVGLMGQGSLPEITYELEQKLKGSQRILIVDEAEYLPKRALDLIRSLHDHTGIAIVLVGMPRLMANLRGKNQDFRQLYSRISMTYNVVEATDNDVKELIYSYFPNSNGLWKSFAAQTKNMRSLVKLVQLVNQISALNDLAPSSEMVSEAAHHLII